MRVHKDAVRLKIKYAHVEVTSGSLLFERELEIENGYMEVCKMDTIFFEDEDRVRKKQGFIQKIESGLVYFIEEPSKQYMMIPTTRIVRIVKDKDGGAK